jgi:hypothetical protein
LRELIDAKALEPQVEALLAKVPVEHLNSPKPGSPTSYVIVREAMSRLYPAEPTKLFTLDAL